MPLTQLGRYKITGTLGRGAMGVVYKAYDPLIDRTVAIKTIDHVSLSREETEEFEKRFKREAKSAGRLNHPNIVTIHDVGRSDDLSYIAMEFLVGRSLREVLDSGHELSLLRIAEITAQIADGLAFAHANDVVHRDIKPANIMLLDHDVVKITDFGVALLPSGGASLEGAACGSPKYMAPEQITGQKVDGRSDIFSLGTVLYEMLAGRPAFSGDDLSSILYQVLNEAPPLPSEYYPSLPNGFDRIVARAMAKNPEKRYQSAGEMAADLRKYRRFAKQEKRRQQAGGTVQSDASTATSNVNAAGETSGETNGEPFPTATTLNAFVGTHKRALVIGVPLVCVALLAGGIGLWRSDTPADAPAAPATNFATTAPEPATASPTTEPSVASTTEPTPAVASETVTAAPVPPAAEEKPSVEAAPAATVVAEAPKVVPVTATGSEGTEPVPPPVSEGKLRLAIAPWGEVYVDNRKVGVSPPLTEVKLAPGKHTIEIRNGSFEPYRQSISLAANASLRIKHKFE